MEAVEAQYSFLKFLDKIRKFLIKTHKVPEDRLGEFYPQGRDMQAWQTNLCPLVHNLVFPKDQIL